MRGAANRFDYRRKMAPKIGAIIPIRCCSLPKGSRTEPRLGLALANRLDPRGLQYRAQLRLVLREEGGVVL
jgi:hypothetical protein